MMKGQKHEMTKKDLLARLKSGRTISRLTIGNLPAKMFRQTASARSYRKRLEEVVADQKGRVSTTDAHLIDEAAGAELHQAICRWLLREKLDKMAVKDITHCSEQIMKSRQTRNRAVKQLGLDRDGDADVIATLYERSGS